MRPSSITTIRSASMMVLMRWATIMKVLFPIFCFRALRSALSVAKSRALKLSSNISTSGFFTRALAMQIRCFCPPETLAPPWAISLLRPSGLSLINSIAWAISAAFIRSPSEAFSSPYLRLLSIVPLKSVPFCGTIPMWLLSSCWVISLMSVPPIRISPSVTS